MEKPVEEWSVEELAAPGLRAFFGIAKAWELEDQESLAILGSPPREIFEAWRVGAVSQATPQLIMRIGHVLGIYRASSALLGDTATVRTWLRGRNLAPVFNGGTPIEYLTRGSVADLATVREYLVRHLDGEW